MASTKQDIEFAIRKQADSIITQSMVRKAAELVGKRAVEIIKTRTANGIDITGKRFGGYNASYRGIKKKLLSGKMKGRGGKPSKTLARFTANATEFRAKKINDFLRLTGQLWQDISWRVTDVTVNNRLAKARVEIFVKNRSLKKVQGLQSTTGRNKYTSYAKKAFHFLGISIAGANKASEEKELSQIWLKTIKENAKVDLKIK